MPFPLQKHLIAAGWNVALNSMTNWENLSVNGVYFKPVRSWGNFNDGVDRIRSDKRLYSEGEASTAWDWIGYHFQYAYLSTTYCNGGRSGKVTIYTLTNQPNTFARYNAMMILPRIDGIDWAGRVTRLIKIPFLDLEASS